VGGHIHIFWSSTSIFQYLLPTLDDQSFLAFSICRNGRRESFFQKEKILSALIAQIIKTIHKEKGDMISSYPLLVVV
jgi:hypothetical protein